jgi:hypothetical protein
MHFTDNFITYFNKIVDFLPDLQLIVKENKIGMEFFFKKKI